jgi:hypothetical protein
MVRERSAWIPKHAFSQHKNKSLMKKIVTIAGFFLAFLPLLVKAQEDGLRFGFQLSPTVGWMNTNTSRINSSGANLGLRMGMIGEFYFRENYAFATGIGFAFNQGGTLQYERVGCFWPSSDLGLPIDTAFNCAVLPAGVRLKYNIQYLEIPLGLKMRTREFGYTRYYVEPALTLGIKTQTRGSVKGPGIGNDIEKINNRSEVNPLNMAWGLGGGIEYSISENTALVGGLAFQVGFVDVTRDGARVRNPTTGELTDRENSSGRVHNVTFKLALMF